MVLSSGNCDCVQQKTLNLKRSVEKKCKSTQHIRFLDLPLEVRIMIYRYIFEGAVLRIDKDGVKHQYSRGHCEILGTCEAVLKEAEPVLFSQATQVFSDATENGRVQNQDLNLRPLYPRSVPALHVFNFHPKNNVRLDMKTLKTYSQLRVLELGLFSEMMFEQAPNFILDADEETVNEDNDPYVVAEIKKMVADKNQYDKLDYKPVNLRGLRAILNSKHRNFRVLLRCEVHLYSVDVEDELPEDYNGLVRFQNHQVLRCC